MRTNWVTVLCAMIKIRRNEKKEVEARLLMVV